MKYQNLIFSFLLLSGCLSRPQYYSSTQYLNIYKSFGIQNAEVSYEENKFQPNETLSIERSYSDKEIIIKKEGYKDYHLKLESQWTDEEWAEFQAIMGSKSNESALTLFLPLNTLTCIEGIPAMGLGLLFLPWGVASDIYNIVIGAPSTAIVNPWRKMAWEKSIILEPTEEYKTKCHQQKDMFISNQGCIYCNMADAIEASPEECARCSNRSRDTYYSKFACVIDAGKLKKEEETVKQECHKRGLIYTSRGCKSCDEIGNSDRFGYGGSISSEECERCHDHSYKYGRCEKDEAKLCHFNGNNFYTSDSKCVDCTSLERFYSTREECKRCTNRVFDKRQWSGDGSTWCCIKIDIQKLIKNNEMEKIKDLYENYDNWCGQFRREDIINLLKKYQKMDDFISTFCPTDKPLLDKNNICHACDEEDIFYISDTYRYLETDKNKKGCQTEKNLAELLCPKRELNYTISFLDCEDKLIGGDGKCHDYSDPNPITTPFRIIDPEAKKPNSPDYLYLKEICEKRKCNGKPCRYLNEEQTEYIRNQN